MKVWIEKFEKYFEGQVFTDDSHGLAHFRRVFKIAQKISTPEADLLVVAAASYFHDIVSYPKDDSRRSSSSRHAAIKAEEILRSMSFPENKIPAVKHCIESHSYSANIQTETIEARIVQDADRMESLGAIGLARTFYVAGQIKSSLFDENDPFAEKRELDDKSYCLDHFKVKLFKLAEMMKTEAIRRQKFLEKFCSVLKEELFL